MGKTSYWLNTGRGEGEAIIEGYAGVNRPLFPFRDHQQSARTVICFPLKLTTSPTPFSFNACPIGEANDIA